MTQSGSSSPIRCCLGFLRFTAFIVLLFAVRSTSAQSESEWTFIENSQLKVGVQRAAGGAIGWISEPDASTSIINSFDRGRLLQQSYYGRVDGSQWNGKPWRWNPVQGGEWRGAGGEVEVCERRESASGLPQLFVRSTPRNWGSGELLTDCLMEQTITLDSELIVVDFLFRYSGSQEHPEADQEIPALFVDPRYDTLVTYEGPEPWTSGALRRVRPGWPNESREMNESWAAYVDDQDSGLGLYVPAAKRLTCYRYGDGSSRDSCSYLAPLTRFAITPGFEWSYRVYVTLGTTDEIRSRFSAVSMASSEAQASSADPVDSKIAETDLPEGSEPPKFSGDADRMLEQYLATEFDAVVTSVEVKPTTVLIRGICPQVSGRAIVEWPMHLSVADAFSNERVEAGTDLFLDAIELVPDSLGRFELELPRFATNEEGVRDRIYSKWAIAQRSFGSSGAATSSSDTDDASFTAWSVVSHARAFDKVESRPSGEWPVLRSRKGLGAWGPGRPESDLDELGVGGVTVNLLLDTFIFTQPGAGRSPFVSQGREWYSNDAALSQLDDTLRRAAERGLLVSVIVLLRQRTQCMDPAWGEVVAHPAATGDGIFVMPNVESPEGVRAYVAALELLAERYSRPSGEHGRIHHWIMHNEVNSGWVWTNAGERSALSFTDLFYRSIRLTHAVIRQFDPHSQVFVSLDHHWTSRHNAQCYGAKQILEHLLDLSRAEGDFDWAVAHHPYPQDLFEPRTWRDQQAKISFQTEKITYNNIEVLVQWLDRPAAWYDGRSRRIHLTEQGLNSRSYDEQDLRNQAAGMAFVWHKLARLDTIEMFHYHNWIDNRHEGGLRIGLRRFPDDEQEPLGKKPIWFVFQALESDRESEATAFALDVIGISDWTSVELPARVPRDESAIVE